MQLHLACRAANDINARVSRLVHVIAYPLHIPLEQPLPKEEEDGVSVLLRNRAEAIAKRYDIACDIVVSRARSVSAVVIAEARESGAEAIFVGLRERRRPGTTLLLSRTLRHILQQAPCPRADRLSTWWVDRTISAGGAPGARMRRPPGNMAAPENRVTFSLSHGTDQE